MRYKLNNANYQFTSNSHKDVYIAMGVLRVCISRLEHHTVLLIGYLTNQELRE